MNSTRTATNFGYLSNLYVGNGNTTFLQFDLTGMPSGITASQIASAKVTVFVNRVNTPGSVSVAAVSSAWSESTVTYGNMPGVSGTVSATFTPGASGTYVTFDITALVQGWVTAPSSNYGIALTSGSGNLLLDSKENDLTGHAASLNVTVTSMGATGAVGATGATGGTGLAGATGAAGANGANGANGATGAAGLAGATGAAGTNGANGVNGATGATGTTGLAGGTGASGTNGTNGATGATGLAGATGASGTNGANGATGAMGATGATGTAGLVGATGASGTNGTNGATGATGTAGLAGATGASGTNGASGATGATGATGTLGAVSQYSASTTYSYGQVVYCQASGACNTADQGSSYVYIGSGSSSAVDPSNTTYWQQIAAAGMAGTNGATGATGATGAAAGGPYSASTAYVAGSVVTYNGATYIANYATTGVYPDSANNPQDYRTHFLTPPWTPINGIASVHYAYTQNGYNYTGSNPSLAGVPYTVVSHSLSSSSYSYNLFSPAAGGEGIGYNSSNLPGTSGYAPAILSLPVDCYGEITIYAPYTTTVTWRLLYANPTSNGTVASPAYGSYNSSTYQPNSPFTPIGLCQTTSTTHSCAIGGGNFAAGTQLSLEEDFGVSSPISFTTAFSCRALSFTD